MLPQGLLTDYGESSISIIINITLNAIGNTGNITYHNCQISLVIVSD